MCSLLPTFEVALREVQWKSKKSGSPVYRIRVSDRPDRPLAAVTSFTHTFALFKPALTLIIVRYMCECDPSFVNMMLLAAINEFAFTVVQKVEHH